MILDERYDWQKKRIHYLVFAEKKGNTLICVPRHTSDKTRASHTDDNTSLIFKMAATKVL